MKRMHHSKRMLRKQDCVKFHGRMHDRVFFKLCWFLRCSAGKKNIKISYSCWWRFQLATSPISTTLLDHCLKSLHNTVKHMNLPTVV